MTAFDDRKTAAEAKFAHDQEFQFKTIARRNKLLGLWAAEQMGISGVDAEAYAKQVVIADFEEPGDADVLRKVLGDLIDKGIATDEHKVRHEMTRLLEEAKTQVLAEWLSNVIIGSLQVSWLAHEIPVRQQRKTMQPLQH